MSLLLDVLEVLARRPVGWILLAHIAETAGKLRQPLAIGALAEPADVQVVGLQKDRAGEEGYYWLRIVQENFREKETATEDRVRGPSSGRKLRRSADQRQPELIVRSISYHV